MFTQKALECGIKCQGEYSFIDMGFLQMIQAVLVSTTPCPIYSV